MNLKYFVFSIFCIVSCSNHQFVLANKSDESRLPEAADNASPELKELLKYVYKILLLGFSKQGIASNAEHQDGDKWLMRAQKSFWINIKGCCDVLLPVIVIMIILYICYLIYSWLPKKSGGFVQSDTASNSGTLPSQKNDSSSKFGDKGTSKKVTSQSQESGENAALSTVQATKAPASGGENKQSSGGVNQNERVIGAQAMEVSELGGESKPPVGGVNQSLQEVENVIRRLDCQPKAPGGTRFVTEYVPNPMLTEAVAQGVEHARNIGLIPTAMIFNDQDFEDRPQRGNVTFQEVITKQLEYARSIGLVPDAQILAAT